MQTGVGAAEQTLFFNDALLADGWARRVRITVMDGRITRLETGADARPGDDCGAVAIAGMPNLHSHAFQRGMAGLAERRGPASDSFWTWREVMYRFVRRMTPDDVRDVAAFAYMEMLESGFTRVGEFHYLHHDRSGERYEDPAHMCAAIADAAGQSGIGLTLLPVLYTYAGFGKQAAKADQARFVMDMDAYGRLLEGADRAVADLCSAIVGAAPHSLRAVSPEQLKDLETLAAGRPVHIHIAEQVKEVEDCLAWSGQRPVEWLLDHADVDSRWCLVHATHMTDAETDAMARSGAIAGLCPVTEANLGDGLFPIERFLDAGGQYGVGSDSNVLIDCAEELRLLEYGQRLARQGRNILARGAGESTGRNIFNAALSGGGAALGRPGGLAVGLDADIVSLEAEHPSLVARSGDALLDSMIFACRRLPIDCVWRYGVKLISNGRHRDRDSILDRYRLALEKFVT